MTESQTNANAPKAKLRWFQFRLRTLLVITALVALGCGTLGLKWKVQWQRNAFAGKLREELGAQAQFHVYWDEVSRWSSRPKHVMFRIRFSGVKQIRVSFVRGTLNDEQLARVQPLLGSVEYLDLGHTQVTDHGLKYVGRMTRLTHLELGDTAISDDGTRHFSGLTELKILGLDGTGISGAGIEHLSNLTKLEVLSLGATRVGDAALAHLGDLPSVERLCLWHTDVTDSGLTHLARLPRLKTLWLSNTQISDVGIEHLAGLKQLEFLSLEHTGVTDEGVSRLRRALPNTEILY